MRFLQAVVWATALLPDICFARSFTRTGGHNGCEFTISSSGPFSRPAAQLSDGRLRLNCSADAATFYIDGSNRITDSQHFGCFGTSPELRCGKKTPPSGEFSIDASNALRLQGSANFYACPVGGWEYGIFVKPEAGKRDCIAISLQASACGAGASQSCSSSPPASSSTAAQASHGHPLSSAAPLLSTVWHTHTKSDLVTQTVTVVATSQEPCTERNLAVSSAAHDSVVQLKPRNVTEEKHALSRRDSGDLNRAWLNVKNNIDTNFVKQNDIKVFDFAMGLSNMFATAEYYGCTVFVMFGGGKLFVGHLSQYNGNKCPLADPQQTERFIVQRIEDLVETRDTKIYLGGAGTCDDIYVVITGTERDTYNTGVPNLKAFFTDGGVRPDNLRYIYYRAGQPTAEFGDGPTTYSPVRGRSLFRWDSFEGGGTMSIFLGNEEPRLVVGYDQDWMVTGVTWSTSPDTTTG